uniref:Gamma-interferon-inducible lysosomal thiol reductase n=1 Tax=Rhizophora mucronata TaxID=61149 RepID=A0A2P2IQH5_RHIMU
MALGKVAAFSFPLALLLICLVSPVRVRCYLNEGGAKDSISADSQKVNLSVYHETLSIPSAKFIVQSLGTIFNNGLSNIINLRMIPWGFARVNKANHTIVCQNKIYALSYCIEFLVIEGRHQNWNSCFDSLGLPIKPVLACYASDNRTKLENSQGYETGHLNPPLGFLPWIVVNNVPVLNDYENFATYVCNEFKGSPVPNACKTSLPNISSTGPVRVERGADKYTSWRPFSRMPKSSKAFYKDPSKVSK